MFLRNRLVLSCYSPPKLGGVARSAGAVCSASLREVNNLPVRAVGAATPP